MRAEFSVVPTETRTMGSLQDPESKRSAIFISLYGNLNLPAQQRGR